MGMVHDLNLPLRMRLKCELDSLCFYTELMLHIILIHRSVLDTFNIPVNGMNEFKLPYLYWIPKLHKIPYMDTYSWI
jgi:hypothetical protein